MAEDIQLQYSSDCLQGRSTGPGWRERQSETDRLVKNVRKANKATDLGDLVPVYGGASKNEEFEFSTDHRCITDSVSQRSHHSPFIAERVVALHLGTQREGGSFQPTKLNHAVLFSE